MCLKYIYIYIYTNKMKTQNMVHALSICFENVDSHICNNNMFNDVPIYFQIFFKVFGIIKAINTGSTGPDLAMNRSKI